MKLLGSKKTLKYKMKFKYKITDNNEEKNYNIIFIIIIKFIIFVFFCLINKRIFYIYKGNKIKDININDETKNNNYKIRIIQNNIQVDKNSSKIEEQMNIIESKETDNIA